MRYSKRLHSPTARHAYTGDSDSSSDLHGRGFGRRFFDGDCRSSTGRRLQGEGSAVGTGISSTLVAIFVFVQLLRRSAATIRFVSTVETSTLHREAWRRSIRLREGAVFSAWQARAPRGESADRRERTEEARSALRQTCWGEGSQPANRAMAWYKEDCDPATRNLQT